MSKRSLLLVAFAAMAVIQLSVPAWVLVRRELTLRNGRQFNFRTQPVDPADVFRGRYVQLRLEPDSVLVPDAGKWEYNQRAYAVLAVDSNGYAVVTGLRRDRPTDVESIMVRIGWHDVRVGEVRINWPMDRYYMEEGKAPAAETAYREHSSRTNRNCHAAVMVLGANAVIAELYIDGRPIKEYLKAR